MQNSVPIKANINNFLDSVKDFRQPVRNSQIVL
jgi:hypothetical protein